MDRHDKIMDPDISQCLSVKFLVWETHSCWLSLERDSWGGGVCRLTSFKDDKFFRSLDKDRWEELCYLLFKQEFAGLHRVDGSGGDDGIDAYIGTFDNPSIVFQFKFFSGGFGKSQIAQIKSSLEKVLETRSRLRKWILACSAEPTPQARRALDNLIAEHPEVGIEIHTEGDMKSKLLKHPAVRNRFYDDGMDVLKSVLALGDMDPVKRAVEGVRIYNDSIVDERFTATVVTDGQLTTTFYSLRPDYLDVPPTFTVHIKSKRGLESYRNLIRFGTPIALSGEDVELDGPDLLWPEMNKDKFQLLKMIPRIDPRPSQLRFYAPDEQGGNQILFVELRTTSEGTERIVRSNSSQEDAPVFFEFILPLSMHRDGLSEKWAINITPHLIGNRVSVAIKGARFLGRLSQTKRLGLSDADGDAEHASFATLDGIDEGGVWTHLLSFIEAIDRVCRFFGIDPTIDDTLNDDEFFRSVMQFDERVRTAGTELDGETTFSLCSPNPDFVSTVDSRDAVSFVADMDWLGSIFGCKVSAKIRVVASGIPSVEFVGDDRWVLTVKGKYRCFIGKSETEIEKSGAPHIFSI